MSVCVNWSGIETVTMTTTKGGGYALWKIDPIQPITEQHAVEVSAL